jgi:Fur family ferric uptake transcriptional regulator
LELLDRQPCALTAIEIEQELARPGAPLGGAAPRPSRRVSRASVYRILDELERLGLVQRVATGQAMVRYEPIRPAEHHHHHLVCNDCGAVTPFSDEQLERAIVGLSARVPLTVSEHEIVLRGRCRACAD